jgi:hypothetical protein
VGETRSWGGGLRLATRTRAWRLCCSDGTVIECGNGDLAVKMGAMEMSGQGAFKVRW